MESNINKFVFKYQFRACINISHSNRRDAIYVERFYFILILLLLFFLFCSFSSRYWDFLSLINKRSANNSAYYLEFNIIFVICMAYMLHIWFFTIFMFQFDIIGIKQQQKRTFFYCIEYVLSRKVNFNVNHLMVMRCK